MANFSPKQFTSKTGDTFVIRSAVPDDAVALLAHLIAVAKESHHLLTEPDEFTMTETEERKWIQDHIDAPGNICLLAEASGVIIACLGCENGQRRRTVHRGTFGMGVLKEWRGRGIGSAILQCFIDWAETNPLIQKVGLSVFATNRPAIDLYRKFKFIEEGRQPKEVKVGSEYTDVILMYKSVE